MPKKGFLLFLICLLCLTPLFSFGKKDNSGKNAVPDWVKNPYSKYNERANVAAVGGGSSREAAEKSALGSLVAVFGQNIQVDEKVSSIYEEAVKSGAAGTWSENVVMNQVVVTSAGIDSLVGAEIAEVWFDGKAEYFAAAVLNKAKALQIYSQMIRSNQAMIDNLIQMTEEEMNTLEGYSRYQFAAAIADISSSYANLLSVIGSPVSGLKRGDDYRLVAVGILKTIPVTLGVQGDKSGRIEGAFARALSALGFRSGGSNSPYTLGVSIVTSPVTLAGNQNKFTRIELTANLSDNSAGIVLVPFSFNLREGHLTQDEADNRAYLAAERKINEEYASLVNERLSALLPKR